MHKNSTTSAVWTCLHANASVHRMNAAQAAPVAIGTPPPGRLGARARRPNFERIPLFRKSAYYY